jgi:hypothetical protein
MKTVGSYWKGSTGEGNLKNGKGGHWVEKNGLVIKENEAVREAVQPSE